MELGLVFEELPVEFNAAVQNFALGHLASFAAAALLADLGRASAPVAVAADARVQTANIITGVFAFRARRSCDFAVYPGRPARCVPPLFAVLTEDVVDFSSVH